ncbi:MAG: hypothetical protein AAF560_09380 [Acidobacteriota bacterium]
MKSVRRPLRALLLRRDLEWWLALLAVLICAPSLWLGLQIDDLVHRAAILGIDERPLFQRSPLEMFTFVSGDPSENFAAVDTGFWPWWSSEELRLRFWRPVSGATHGLDYKLWPDAPWLMHAHSLAWLALTVVAATRFYRRTCLPKTGVSAPAVAGLAALLFALDDVHGWAAVWIANRNALIAAAFTLLALISHDRWRREGWRAGALWTPVLMVLGLLGNEGAVATGAYLLAYALFLDRGSWRQRLASLLPATLTGVAWATAYKLLGYGAAKSGVYIDPGTSPQAFVSAVVERIPALLRGLLAWPPAEIDLLFARSHQAWVWWLSFALAVLFATVFWMRLRHIPAARFFAFGMLLSLLPACATFPANRLLLMASLGGIGLIALLCVDLWRTARSSGPPSSGPWRWPAGAALAVLGLIHVVIPPLSIGSAMLNIKAIGGVITQAAASLPSDERVVDQRLVIVNTPTAFVSSFGPIMQAQEGLPASKRVVILGSSIFSMNVHRTDAQTLVVRPVVGYLSPVGTPPPGSQPPIASPAFLFQMLDHLFRDVASDPFVTGDRIELSELAIEILEAESGRPMAVAFRFAVPLEDPSLRWVSWQDGVYVPFELLAIGESVDLKSRIVLPGVS